MPIMYEDRAEFSKLLNIPTYFLETKTVVIYVFRKYSNRVPPENNT